MFRTFLEFFNLTTSGIGDPVIEFLLLSPKTPSGRYPKTILSSYEPDAGHHYSEALSHRLSYSHLLTLYGGLELISGSVYSISGEKPA